MATIPRRTIRSACYGPLLCASGPRPLADPGQGQHLHAHAGPGETVLSSLPRCSFKDLHRADGLHFEQPGGTWRSWRTWGERYVWLRLYGPGRVAMESAFAHMEDPGNNMVNSSQATWSSW